jgi:Xaa-Pro aminopeptidase
MMFTAQLQHDSYQGHLAAANGQDLFNIFQEGDHLKSSVIRLRKAMKEHEIDAAIISSKDNLRYYSGFTAAEAILLILPEDCCLITDFRYIEQAHAQCPDFRVIDAPGAKTAQFIQETCLALDARKIWFEDSVMSFREYSSFKETLEPLELVSAQDIPSMLRILKTEEEVNNIRKAAALADKGFSHMLNYLRPGLTEMDVALELEFFLRKNGSEGLAFPIIAGSGKNGSLPHAEPSDKRLANGEFITLDFGCIVNGYNSDMTRTVALGEPGELMREIYGITLEAQQKALDVLCPGITGIYADKQARDHIHSKGYGDCFGHGLGHGVGLNIHEAPTLSRRGDTVLEPGMVVTVEPGIYLPGKGGVRIEDLVVITENGFDNLVSSRKDLIQL